MEENRPRAWIVDVSMGYGHQRTAYPLRFLAPNEKVISANSYEGIPQKDKKIWDSNQRFYEFISAFKKTPIIGNIAFSAFDYFQKIFEFYPKRDLSRPNVVLKNSYRLFGNGWGRSLIEKLSIDPIPLISTFFIPAFMAEFFNYPGDIFCVVCDADISRTWAPLYPSKSRIKYFAPNKRVVERLKLYGVRSENIFLTGFPLPKENISKDDLKHRLLNLDPRKTYLEKYSGLVREKLGNLPESSDHPLTLMFAVGGAGAQKDIAVKAVKSLSKKIKAGEIELIISVGAKEEVRSYFDRNLKNPGVKIIFNKNLKDYFEQFNLALRKTDILWTKPSELSFYTGLGLPIIIAPTIGSQEDFNEEWLLNLGSGRKQGNPEYAAEWLFDEINSGWFAEAAMQGFIEAEKMGTFNIETCLSVDRQ